MHTLEAESVTAEIPQRTDRETVSARTKGSRQRILKLFGAGLVTLATVGVGSQLSIMKSEQGQASPGDARTIPRAKMSSEEYFRAVRNAIDPEHPLHGTTFLDLGNECMVLAQACAERNHHTDSRYFWIQAEEALMQQLQYIPPTGSSQDIEGKIVQCREQQKKLASHTDPLQEGGLSMEYALAVASIRERMAKLPSGNPLLAQGAREQ